MDDTEPLVEPPIVDPEFCAAAETTGEAAGAAEEPCAL